MVTIRGYQHFLETEPRHIELIIRRLHVWSKSVVSKDTTLSITVNSVTWDMKMSTTEKGIWDLTKTIDGQIIKHWRFPSHGTERGN